jgi:MFS family permease
MPTVSGRFRSVSGHPLLLVALSGDALGSGLFAPFSVLYFHAISSLSLVTIGLGLSLAALVRFPMTVMAGMVIDKLGPRRVVILSNLLQAAGFASYLSVQSFGHLVVSAALVQLGNSTFWVAYPALVHEAADGRSQEPWFAVITGLRFAGLGLGGLAAGAAVAAGGTRGYFSIVALNAASFALSALLVWIDNHRHSAALRQHSTTPKRTDRRPSAKGWGGVLTNRGFMLFAGLNVSLALLCMAFAVGAPVFLVTSLHLPTWIPGGVLAINAALGALGVAPVLGVIRHHRRRSSLIISQLIVAIGYLMLLISGAVPTPVAICLALATAVCVTLMELIQGAIVPAVINACAGDGDRGRYNSVYQMAFGLADTAAPALITALLAHGAAVTWGPMAGLAVLNCAAIGALGKHLRPLRERVTAPQGEPEVTR